MTASILQYLQYSGKSCTIVVGNNLISFLPQPGQISHLSFSIILLHMFEFVNSFLDAWFDALLFILALPPLLTMLFQNFTHLQGLI